MRKKNSFFEKNISFFLLAVVLIVLVIFNVCFHDHWLDSDMAAEMIFSRLVAEEGGYIASANWFYSTEFRILYTQLIMVPLFHITSNWHVIRAVTNIITYVLLLSSYYFFMNSIADKADIKKGTVIFSSLFLLLPFSETMIIHMSMGNTYMPHLILIFLWLGILFRAIYKNHHSISYTIFLIVSLALLSLLLGMSGVRYFMCLFAPVLLSFFICLFRNDEFVEMRKTAEEGNKQISTSTLIRSLFTFSKAKAFYLCLCSAFIGLVGYGVNVLYICRKYTFQTYESTNFITVFNGIFLERVQNTFGKILDLFGYIPEKSVLSLRGIISLLAFVMLGIVIYITVNVFKNAEGVSYVLVLLCVSSFGINLFVSLFTNSTIVARYFLPVFALWLPVLAIYLDGDFNAVDREIVKIVLCIAMILMVAKVSYSFVTVDKNQDVKNVTNFLKEEGYEFGYATYWNANIVTEISNGDIEVANISDPEKLEFFKWSSPAKYYNESYYTGRVFLLLTKDESAEYADSDIVKNGNCVYDSNNYCIYEFANSKELLNFGTGK